jgi:hypothetical protein
MNPETERLMKPPAEPAKPSTLADRVRAMMAQNDAKDWGQTIDNLARAINAVARAVDDLAKEAKR